ncbi:hypothetical protein AMJ85_08315 [candidate division BRC1 bacterium SM23_51]|nr:MAG: hypothetical protein AMJ85_08315 [candidate division BRC1 bacterium SM23_51]
MIANSVAAAVTVGYAVASIIYIAHFFRRGEGVGRGASVILYAALAAHTVWLVVERARLGRLPLVSAYEALSFVAWGIALAYVVLELRFRQRVFGAFVTPVAFLFQAVASAFLLKAPPAGPLPAILQSGWFEAHVGTALFSYCAFAIAFAAGLMHVLLCHELRLRRLGFFFTRLPPLDVLERINYQAVALGFLFLTIGIATGVIWSLTARAGAVLLDAKEISAVIVWLLYAANVHTRWRMGWRGQRAAIFSVANFALLFAIFCLTSFVLKAHQF